MSGQNSSDPIASHIGERIKTKRKQLGWTQRGLATKADVAYQQIQKYESGANRVSSPTLYFIGQAMGVPVSYFYEGLEDRSTDLCAQVISLSDGEEMLRSFVGISNPQSRATLVALAKTLACSENAAKSNA